ncbi:hypothetical protein AGMMS49992_29470 [Clostridia bacterium]|nr:hypothetical protein AGMMS49992_29470 [Clostridia bacterium]
MLTSLSKMYRYAEIQDAALSAIENSIKQLTREPNNANLRDTLAYTEALYMKTWYEYQLENKKLEEKGLLTQFSDFVNAFHTSGVKSYLTDLFTDKYDSRYTDKEYIRDLQSSFEKYVK